MEAKRVARSELRHNPKFKRLVHKLALPAPYVVGLLECLWQCAYASGDDVIGDATDIELAAEWPGQAGVFSSACADVGFVDEEDGEYRIHDLYDHAPEYVLKRILRRESGRALKIKDLRKKTADNGRRTADSDRSTYPHTIPTNLAADAPHGSRPDQGLPEDDKSKQPSSIARKTRKAATGPAAEFECHFKSKWQARYVQEYPWKRGKDDQLNKWVREHTASPERAKAAVDAYFASEDKFVLKNRHSLGLLVSQFEKFIVPEAQPSSDAFERAENSEEIAAQLLREGEQC